MGQFISKRSVLRNLVSKNEVSQPQPVDPKNVITNSNKVDMIKCTKSIKPKRGLVQILYCPSQNYSTSPLINPIVLTPKQQIFKDIKACQNIPDVNNVLLYLEEGASFDIMIETLMSLCKYNIILELYQRMENLSKCRISDTNHLNENETKENLENLSRYQNISPNGVIYNLVKYVKRILKIICDRFVCDESKQTSLISSSVNNLEHIKTISSLYGIDLDILFEYNNPEFADIISDCYLNVKNVRINFRAGINQSIRNNCFHIYSHPTIMDKILEEKLLDEGDLTTIMENGDDNFFQQLRMMNYDFSVFFPTLSKKPSFHWMLFYVFYDCENEFLIFSSKYTKMYINAKNFIIKDLKPFGDSSKIIGEYIWSPSVKKELEWVV